MIEYMKGLHISSLKMRGAMQETFLVSLVFLAQPSQILIDRGI